uniref:Uncharacterized protein n=1 Tax=Anabas testudineus TaxID=64144 RepID=A0A3Q1JPP4_ANATE
MHLTANHFQTMPRTRWWPGAERRLCWRIVTAVFVIGMITMGVIIQRERQDHQGKDSNYYTSAPNVALRDEIRKPEGITDPVETPIQEANITHSTCLCSNGDGQFMGLSRCEKPVAGLTTKITVSTSRPVNITFKDGQIVSVHNSLHAPAYKGIPPIENFYWFCGAQAFLFLPSGWSGCCYFVNLTIVNLALVPVNIENTMNHVHKREMAQFANIDSYHWRVSLGEKWGIGLFPWYGVTFLADHIDNITYSMSAFANETIKAFHYLAANDKSHRLTLLKHEMALDYLLAKTGGICLTLNLTGEACVTLIPDNSDNVTTVITALEKIRDAFGPSESAGFSFNKWLIDNFGPWGAGIVQLLIPVVVVFGLMICFCTCSLTCMRENFLLQKQHGGEMWG